MVQRPARRSPSRRPSPRPQGLDALGAVALGLVVAGAAAVLGDGEALWLALPAALAVAARATHAREALVRAALVGAAAVGMAALAGTPALPSAALLPVGLAASVGTLLAAVARLRAERDALELSATHDPLTSLANRRAFDERVGYEIARHSRRAASFALVALDLDGFKAVNDRFGHQGGDELLLEVAGALRQSVREQDTVARMGGDEFCVLAPETDLDGAHRLATRVGAAIAGVTAGVEALGASVGVAVFPDDGQRADEVLAAADAAAMQAKRRVRARRGRHVPARAA